MSTRTGTSFQAAVSAAPDSARESAIREAVDAAASHLLDLQQPDGHWRGELEGDSILESELILLLHFIGRGDDPLAAAAAEHLRRQQLAGGGWASYPGGPPDVNASAKSYFVLKLLGDDPGAPHMERARHTVVSLGGLDACNSFTRIYLAIFGQYPWGRCPAVPPELVLLPSWVPFNIYDMSAWTRTIVVPLSVIWAAKPACPVPGHADLAELRTASARPAPRRGWKARLWTAFFVTADHVLRWVERARLRPWRARALRRAEAWILARLRKSDGLGAIFPPIVNTIIALRCLGYPLDHPVLASQVAELERLVIRDGDTARIEPCLSPVWDTALALNALRTAGLPADHPAVLAAARWLLDHEVTEPGDWRVQNPEAPVGGWYFEYANEFYPDCDDTAEVLTALSKVHFPNASEELRRRDASLRGLAWLLGMQNRDGGWASFDRGCDKRFLTFVPFADHNAMIDPSTSDITARVLETLANLGGDLTAAPRERAVAFLRRRQEADGAWYGRWGCNYLYGTWLALWGLRAVGEDLGQDLGRRAVAWLERCQNADGGWGELPASYDDPALAGQGPSTATQTAWALLALLAAGERDSPAVGRGIDHLLANQLPAGGWYDEPWTATGFPRVFYLRYHMYAVYFPLLALGTYLASLDAGAAEGAPELGAPGRQRADEAGRARR